jgi:hypothetical protein
MKSNALLNAKFKKVLQTCRQNGQQQLDQNQN